MSEFKTFTFGAPEPRHPEDDDEEHVRRGSNGIWKGSSRQQKPRNYP
jgi:hypothetical protein